MKKNLSDPTCWKLAHTVQFHPICWIWSNQMKLDSNAIFQPSSSMLSNRTAGCLLKLLLSTMQGSCWHCGTRHWHKALAQGTAAQGTAAQGTGTRHCGTRHCGTRHWHKALWHKALWHKALAQGTAGTRHCGTRHCSTRHCGTRHWHKALRHKALWHKALWAQGTVAQGTAAQGTAAQGTVAQGTVAQGTVAQGTVAQGTVAQGTAAQGTVAQGTVAQGTGTRHCGHKALWHKALWHKALWHKALAQGTGTSTLLALWCNKDLAAMLITCVWGVAFVVHIISLYLNLWSVSETQIWSRSQRRWSALHEMWRDQYMWVMDISQWEKVIVLTGCMDLHNGAMSTLVIVDQPCNKLFYARHCWYWKCCFQIKNQKKIIATMLPFFCWTLLLWRVSATLALALHEQQ